MTGSSSVLSSFTIGVLGWRQDRLQLFGIAVVLGAAIAQVLDQAKCQGQA